MKKLKVRLTLIEEMLGTSPANKKLYSNYIASKAPKPEEIMDEELEALPKNETENMTVFPRTADDKPFTFDYQIRGFLKEACGIMKQIPGTKSSKVKANKKKVDNYISAEPRQIVWDTHGMKTDECERPLRASTPMGERTALAKSETVPAGSTCEFEIICLIDDDIDLVKELLNYGAFKGLGQWRNSGKGRFEWEEIKEETKEEVKE